MNITLDLSPYVHQHAGLGRYAGELLAALKSGSPQNEYTALYHSTHEIALAGEIANTKTWRVPLPAKPWRMSVLLAFYLGFTMDRWLPRGDVFHATDHLLPPLKDSRSVFTIHDMIFRFFPEYHLPLNRWFLNLMLPKFLERADAVIAVSENTKRDILNWTDIASEKISVVYEGVNPSFRPIQDNEELQRVRAAYNLPPAFLLFFSTIEPRKNLITLLDAYAELLKRQADIPPLVVMGRKGWLYESTLKHIDELGLGNRVVLTDWVKAEDVPRVINLADVFVFPSLYEGFGLTPLEAMACGTPVISSSASSLPEVIGDGGILIDPHDVGGMGDAIIRVLTDSTLRQELRERGLKQASQFTWERAARETVAIYERVARK